MISSARRLDPRKQPGATVHDSTAAPPQHRHRHIYPYIGLIAILAGTIVWTPLYGEPAPGTYESSQVTLLSRVPLDDFQTGSTLANDVWGYTSPGGREYGILGLEIGTGFVDLTDPTQPTIVEVIPDAESVWSDMAVYGHHAYNVNENSTTPDGLQIIDLSSIDAGIVTLAGTYTGDGLSDAHNITIDESSGYAYLSASNVAPNGMLVLDLSEPLAPVVAGIWDSLYVHDVTVVSYDSGAYTGREIAFAALGTHGVAIVDVTDKAAMSTLSNLIYPTIGYAHQGWLSEDRTTFFLDDELDERDGAVETTTTYVFDVTSLESPSFIQSYTNGLEAIDHNLMVRGDHVFQANFESGLRVVDAADPHAMFEVGFFDTFPASDSTTFRGAWGVYTGLPSGTILVSDRQSGLFALEFTPPTASVSTLAVRPAQFELGVNVPNPFNPSTSIPFELSVSSTVTLRIFDVSGHHVRTLIDGEYIRAGAHRVQWDGRNARTSRVPSGVYVSHLDTRNGTATRVMTLVR